MFRAGVLKGRAMSSSFRKGFTIIELAVTMAIIGVILALLLPAVQAARESSRRLACKSNLRQLALALHQYESAFSLFPPGSQVQDFQGLRPYSKALGWPIALLPHIEQSPLFSEFNTDLDAQIHHRAQTRKQLPLYQCPSDPNAGVAQWRREKVDPYWGDYYTGDWGTTNYLGVSGISAWQLVHQPNECSTISFSFAGHGLHDGMFFGNSAVRLADVYDGTSSTLLVGERGVTLGWGKWGGPGVIQTCPMGLADVLLPGVDIGLHGPKDMDGMREAVGQLDDRAHWWSWHSAGCNFAFVDGSVRLIPYSIDRMVMMEMSTRSGGEF